MLEKFLNFLLLLLFLISLQLEIFCHYFLLKTQLQIHFLSMKKCVFRLVFAIPFFELFNNGLRVDFSHQSANILTMTTKCAISTNFPALLYS